MHLSPLSSGHFIPRERIPWCSLNKKVGGPQGYCGCDEEKITASFERQTLVIQPRASNLM
jgi:hypothetical protein